MSGCSIEASRHPVANAIVRPRAGPFDSSTYTKADSALSENLIRLSSMKTAKFKARFGIPLLAYSLRLAFHSLEANSDIDQLDLGISFMQSVLPEEISKSKNDVPSNDEWLLKPDSASPDVQASATCDLSRQGLGLDSALGSKRKPPRYRSPAAYSVSSRTLEFPLKSLSNTGVSLLQAEH